MGFVGWSLTLFLITLAHPGGLVLFGLLSIIMDVFKIVSYVGYIHCDSAVKVAFPVVQLVFVFVQVIFFFFKKAFHWQLQRNLKPLVKPQLQPLIVVICLQTYFLWVHAKDCVQVQRNLTR